MNEDKIFQGVQIIAQFMGWTSERIRIYIVGRNGNMGKLAYNESWDLLEEVILKIESIKEKDFEYRFNISGDGISITKYDDGSGIISQRVNELGKSKLQPSFEVVLDFCCDFFKMERLT